MAVISRCHPLANQFVKINILIIIINHCLSFLNYLVTCGPVRVHQSTLVKRFQMYGSKDMYIVQSNLLAAQSHNSHTCQTMSYLQCRYSQMVHFKLVIIRQCAPSYVATRTATGCHYNQCFIGKVYTRLFIV